MDKVVQDIMEEFSKYPFRYPEIFPKFENKELCAKVLETIEVEVLDDDNVLVRIFDLNRILHYQRVKNYFKFHHEFTQGSIVEDTLDGGVIIYSTFENMDRTSSHVYNYLNKKHSTVSFDSISTGSDLLGIDEIYEREGKLVGNIDCSYTVPGFETHNGTVDPSSYHRLICILDPNGKVINFMYDYDANETYDIKNSSLDQIKEIIENIKLLAEIEAKDNITTLRGEQSLRGRRIRQFIMATKDDFPNLPTNPNILEKIKQKSRAKRSIRKTHEEKTLKKTFDYTNKNKRKKKRLNKGYRNRIYF